MGAFGSTLFSVGGTVIGAYVGGPTGAAIGGAIGGLIGGLIFAHHPKPVIPSVQLMNAAYGQPIPIIYGEVLLAGNFAWMGDPKTVDNSPGKGGAGGKGPSQATTTQDAQLIFCESPLGNAQMLHLFLDGKMYVNNSSKLENATFLFFSVGIPHGSYRVCDGNENQVPDFLYEVWASEHVPGGSDYIPAFRGMGSLIFSNLDITPFGSRFPQVTAVWKITDAPKINNFIQLKRFSTDTQSLNLHSLCVDWVRGVAYTLSDDGTLRAYNLQSGQCIIQRLNTSLSGITCGQGTYMAGWSGGPGFLIGTTRLHRIDPNSLFIEATLEVTDLYSNASPGDWFISAAGMMIAAPIQGSAVYADASLGTTLSGSGTLNQLGIAVAVLQPSTFFSSIRIFQGNYNAIEQREEIWAIVWDNTVGPDLYLYKMVTDSSNFFSPGLVRIFHPSDVGGAASATTADAFWDASDDSIVFQNMNWSPVNSFKYRSATDQIVWTSTSTGGGAAAVNQGALQDLTIGTVTTSTLPPDWPGLRAGIAGLAPSGNTVVFQGNDGEVYVGFIQRISPDGYPVADIISDICARAGLDATTTVDVSLITDVTTGYAIKDMRSAGAALRDLCQVYLIDMVESDFKLKFVPRGQAEVLTIPQDDLCSTDPNDNSKYWMGHRPQELEMPLQIIVRYSDANLDYQPGSAQAQRTALPVPTMFSKRRQTVDLAITTDNPTARQIAEKWLYTLWAERATYQTGLGPKYYQLDPADNVGVSLQDGSLYHVRLSQTELSPNLMLAVNASTENVTTYSGSTTPGAQVGFTPQTVVQAPFGQPLLFNTPLLRDSDEIDVSQMRVYMAAGSMASTWVAGGMYESPDGSTYSLVVTLSGAANWGYTRQALGSTVAAFATDRVNTITLAFSPGSTLPTSCTYTDMMNGANAALVGSEIIQFQNVTTNGDGTCTLDTLLRGRRGTEWAVDGHLPGEILLLLVPGQVFGGRLPIAQRNVTEQWKLVPNGRFFDQAPGASFAYLGYDKYPYAPVGFQRTVAGSDLLLTWVRRTRIGGLLADGTDDIPLSESSEAYEAYVLLTPAAIDAFDPATPATYTRKFSGMSTPQVTYTAAEMTTDGFMPATDTLYLVVYQLSAVVGRGFRGYRVLPAF